MRSDHVMLTLHASLGGRGDQEPPELPHVGADAGVVRVRHHAGALHPARPDLAVLRMVPAEVIDDCRAKADAWFAEGKQKPASRVGATG